MARGVWLGCKHGRNGGVDMAGHPGRALKMTETLKMAASEWTGGSMNLALRTRFNAERSIRSVHGEYAGW